VARYSLRIKQSAATEIEAVARKSDLRRIVERIYALGDDPRPTGCEKLAGYTNRYRVRQGTHRIVYSVDDDVGAVDIVKIGRRREVYR
jgi:mRNA interferase RelE/StbE